MLDEKDVKHISNLARIELTQEEIKKYQEQLGKVLDYVNKLKQVDTQGIKTADGGTRDLENIFRQDENKTQDTINNKQDLVDMAPERENGQVKVKSILN